MLLEQAIGREVRRQREKLDVTITELAKAARMSAGMLSKIENGATSPSLTSLQALAQALQVPLTTFFRNFDEMPSATLVKAGQGLTIERRGTRAGHQYQLLGHVPTGPLMVEPYLITLTTASDVFPTFQHDGLEFLYMLEGEVCVPPRQPDLPADTRRFALLRRRGAARAGRAAPAAGPLFVGDQLCSGRLKRRGADPLRGDGRFLARELHRDAEAGGAILEPKRGRMQVGYGGHEAQSQPTPGRGAASVQPGEALQHSGPVRDRNSRPSIHAPRPGGRRSDARRAAR